MADFDIDEGLHENEALMASIAKQMNCTVFGMTFNNVFKKMGSSSVIAEELH